MSQFFIPFEINFAAKPPIVNWVETQGLDLSKPFFFQSVDDNLKRKCKTFSSSIEAISRLANTIGFYDDHNFGFIFHSSRCGSTLTKSLLGALPTTFVLSEPQPLSALLLEADNSNRSLEDTIIDVSILFRDLLKIYFTALSRLNCKNKMIVKFVSWNTLWLPWIQQNFPQIRCLFIYRNPVEIIVSLMKSTNPPAKSAAKLSRKIASRITSIPESHIESLSYEEYLAITIENYLNIALQCISKGTLKKLDYEELGYENFLSVIEWFNIEVTTDLASIYSRITKKYSKDPSKDFTSDSQQKQASASQRLTEIVDRSAMIAYLRLKDQDYS